jgi:hypothetical protein
MSAATDRTPVTGLSDDELKQMLAAAGGADSVELITSIEKLDDGRVLAEGSCRTRSRSSTSTRCSTTGSACPGDLSDRRLLEQLGVL